MITNFKIFENVVINNYWQKNVSINELTDESKETLLKIFNTLSIPYDLDIFNDKWKLQSVIVKDVNIEIIKKILNVNSLYQDYDLLKVASKLDITFTTGDIYTNKYFSLESRGIGGDLDFSIPIATFKNDKWCIDSDIKYTLGDNSTLTSDDLETYRLERDTKKYNL